MPLYRTDRNTTPENGPMKPRVTEDLRLAMIRYSHNTAMGKYDSGSQDGRDVIIHMLKDDVNREKHTYTFKTLC